MSEIVARENYPSRLRVAAAVLKALFTTSPFRTSYVIPEKDGTISIVTEPPRSTPKHSRS